MKRVLLFCSLCLLAACNNVNKEEARLLESPGDILQMEFYLDADGVPTYSLDRGDVEVMLPSALGFELRGVVKAQGLKYDGDKPVKYDEVDPYFFNSGFELLGTEEGTLDETWSPVWGEEAQIRNNYNELLVRLRHKADGKLMDIRFRLYDDGMGFRYEFPAQEMTHFVIKEELSEFNCAQDNTAWWIPGDFDNQELEYATTKLSGIPAVFKAHTNQSANL